MEISAERLRELERIEMKMNALEAGGVDNWEFYGDALKEYNKNIENEEKIVEAFDGICEVLSEGIEEPAGRGCGYGFREKATDNAYLILKNLIKDIKK